jgi:transposase
MTYSIDFRKKALEIRAKEKLSISKTAKRFGNCSTTIVNLVKNIVPKLGRNKRAIKIDMNKLVEDVKEYLDSYNHERANRLGVSTRGIGHALKRLGITYKKNFKSSKGKIRREAYFSEKNR